MSHGGSMDAHARCLCIIDELRDEYGLPQVERIAWVLRLAQTQILRKGRSACSYVQIGHAARRFSRHRMDWQFQGCSPCA